MLNPQVAINLDKTDPNFVSDILGQPPPSDTYLARRLGWDYDRYLEMFRDAHIRAVLQKRRQSVIGRNVLFESPIKNSRGKRACDLAEQITDRIRYEGFCASLLRTGQLIGFSVCQIDYEQQGDLVVPKWRFVPQRRFVFNYPEPEKIDVPVCTDETLDPHSEIVIVDGYELRLLTKRSPLSGERCPKDRFVVYTFDADGSPWGMGLGYSIFPWWTIKRAATKSWVGFAERSGFPPVIGLVPPELNTEDEEAQAIIRTLENFLRSISPNGWARLPIGFEVKVVEALASAGTDSLASLIALADAQISKAVLGEVPTSDRPVGGYAANVSQVEDREMSITDADCNILDECIQRDLWTKTNDLNYPNVPVIVRRETVADQRKKDMQQQDEQRLMARAQRDTVLLQFLVPSEDYIHRTYGEDWTLKPQPPAQPAPQEQPPPGDNQQAKPETPPPPEMAEAHDFGAIVHQVLSWNGLDIGLTHRPGEVRFPGKKYSQQLRAGYGHLRGVTGPNGKAARCYVHPALLKGEKASDRMFEILQQHGDGDDSQEPKYMIGWDSPEDAVEAYLGEMPDQFFRGIREVVPADLKKQARFNELLAQIMDLAQELVEVNQDKSILAADFRDYVRDWRGRFARKAGPAALHLVDNVAAWKFGKLVGPLASNYLTQHGVNPDAAKLLGEAIPQAIAATLLHARHGHNIPSSIARTFIAEIAAALVGKIGHGNAEAALAYLGGSDHVQAIGAAFAGKTSGLTTNLSTNQLLAKYGARIQSLVVKAGDFSDYYAFAGTNLQLADADLEAIVGLALAGYLKAGVDSTLEWADLVDKEPDDLSDAEWDELAAIDEDQVEAALKLLVPSGEIPQMTENAYYFDLLSGTYRDRTTNQSITGDRLFRLLQDNILNQRRGLVDLPDQLAAGKINLRQFQIAAANALRQIHIQSAVLGRGDRKKMGIRDWAVVGKELLRQLRTGEDPQTKRQFGLKWFVKELPNLSLAQQRNALRQFADSGKVSYWSAATRSAGRNTLVIRRLGNLMTGHCEDCIRMAELPPMPPSKITLPGQGCKCGPQCACRLEFISLEDAIARGYKPEQ